MESNNLEFRIPKSEWGDGPWQNEPDRAEFKHAGMACMISRGPYGAWCGYVAVPAGHPCYEVNYGNLDVEVHGEPTYSNKCGGHICHVPEPGEPDDVWWIGFDCGHSGFEGDLVPADHAMHQKLSHLTGIDIGPRFGMNEVYRDQAYVTAETKRLAEQLAAIV